ncbi:hypothetical protein V496_02531 [Pseudogymnoascus sp. VKM F-4515 (FW-2607)]|nr:hypothetical protein V496_02531 [Pseudogymnoascus sp. VKM F-4515 (FW-2607)]
MEKPITLKVLMIHGYGQSGPLLDIKTSRLQHALQEAFTNHTRTCEVRFCFPTAPCRILVPSLRELEESPTGGQLESLDMWTWCMDYSSGGNKFFDENRTISDLDDALDSIAEIIRQHGPFDGVIGFSSGACIAALIASLLEEGREQAFEKWESKNGMPYPNSFLREDRLFHAMSLLPQLKGVDLSDSRTTRESSPRSTLGLDQDQERSPTPNLNPHLDEESVNGNTIDLSEAAASRKYVVVMILQSLIAMFRKRECNLCLGEIQNETAESAGQTASRLEASLQLTSELIASDVQTQGKSSPRHAIHNPGKKILHSMVRWIRSVQTITNSGYTIQVLMVRFLQSSGTLPFLHPTDKLRASEFEISELRKKNEALKSILHKCRSSDENGGTEGGDMAGSDIHVSVSPTGPAKKRGKFE